MKDFIIGFIKFLKTRSLRSFHVINLEISWFITTAQRCNESNVCVRLVVVTEITEEPRSVFRVFRILNQN